MAGNGVAVNLVDFAISGNVTDCVAQVYDYPLVSIVFRPAEAHPCHTLCGSHFCQNVPAVKHYAVITGPCRLFAVREGGELARLWPFGIAAGFADIVAHGHYQNVAKVAASSATDV